MTRTLSLQVPVKLTWLVCSFLFPTQTWVVIPVEEKHFSNRKFPLCMVCLCLTGDGTRRTKTMKERENERERGRENMGLVEEGRWNFPETQWSEQNSRIQVSRRRRKRRKRRNWRWKRRSGIWGKGFALKTRVMGRQCDYGWLEVRAWINHTDDLPSNAMQMSE